MSSDFKELNLDRVRLKECIEEFWEANGVQQGKYIETSEKSHRAFYEQDDCEVKVDLLFRRDGTTTIQTKIGKHPDKGEQLACHLKEKLVGDNRKGVYVTVKNIGTETFEMLLAYLQEVEDLGKKAFEVQIHADDEVKKVIKANSLYNDSLTVTHFRTTKKLLLQGKPLFGYNQASYFLSEYADLDGFIEIVSKGEENSRSVNIDKKEIENTLQQSLPNAYSHLGEGILKMLDTSYILKEISIPLQDYSCYVFPALRALEAVMRRLLFQEGFSIETDNANSFGGIFYKDSSGKFFARDDFKADVGNPKVCEAVGYCYNYFHQQRHELFHANDFTDASRFIDTEEQAKRIIEKTVDIIDTAYRIAMS